MEKIEINATRKVIFAIPPEPINETEPIDLATYLIPRPPELITTYDKIRRFGEGRFKTKIGGTTYEISTHFNPNGRQCVMEQFKELILSEKLI